MLPLQSTQACGRAGFCEKILRFSPAAHSKILGFFLWLSAKAPSMQACVLFHSRIYFPYTIVFFVTPLLSFRILVKKNEKKSKKNIKFTHQLLTKSLERDIFIFTVATLSCDSAKETKSSLTDQGRK